MTFCIFYWWALTVAIIFHITLFDIKLRGISDWMCIYRIQSIMLLIITWKYWSILSPLCTVSFKVLKNFLYNSSCDWFVPNYCLNCMTFYSIYFGSARVLLPHAELHHLSTSINGRRGYRLDQSTPPPAAIVRRSPTQCRRPRTPPRKLPRSSHESLHAPLALYPPRTSHFTITRRGCYCFCWFFA